MEIRRRPPNPKVRVANLEYCIPHDDSKPRNILEEIVWAKDKEVEASRERVPLENLKSKIIDLPKPKDFISALKKTASLPAIIAEVKKASPSRGIIRKNFNPIDIAKSYQEGGASCISVLTEKTFFQGGFEILSDIRKAVSIPLLCKDFILMPYQLFQARIAGADAVLLIAAILSDQDLTYLRKVAFSLNLQVLVEVHDHKEMERVLNIGGFPLIGINNRDLKNFQTDLSTTGDLVSQYKNKLIKNNSLIVSESGLFTRSDLDKVYSFGAHAVLIGEALMRQEDLASVLKDLTCR